MQCSQLLRQDIQNHAVGRQEEEGADGEFEQVIDKSDALPVCSHKFIAACVEGNGEKYQRIQGVADDSTTRSEERRVGKECRSRWSPYH